MPSPSGKTYIDNLSQYSRNILAALIRLGLSKQWFCRQVGIKVALLNYKLRNPSKFNDHEKQVIKDLLEAEKLKFQ